MEELELIAFQIISLVGTARSLYIEAIQLAKKGEFALSKEKMAEGENIFIEGHKIHAKLIQQEANQNPVKINLLLMHAEDQLMSAETFKILADELIEVYQKIQK